jgi:uncharacterized protein
VALESASRSPALLSTVYNMHRTGSSVLSPGRAHGPLCPSELGRPIPYLDRVALDFPDLRVVAGHIGFPWTLEMISLATRYPNVYIDTSACKVSRYPRELMEYLRAHRSKKVIFGSNHPAWPAKDCLAGLDALNLDAETTELFLYKNAERVFSLQK